MMWLSMISFMLGLWMSINKVEFMVMKNCSSPILDCLNVIAWTAFAWSMGLFS